MLRYAQSDSSFYVTHAQMHKYCILDTVVTEPATVIKTKNKCIEIAGAEVTPGDNWLEFKICFPIRTFPLHAT
jgi:hypothetical protein